MFDHSLWEKARKVLCANDAFPEPWDKVRSEPGIVDLSAEEAAEKEADLHEGGAIASSEQGVTAN
jgi:hypothetical protein